METFFNVTFNLVGKVSVKLKSRQNQWKWEKSKKN